MTGRSAGARPPLVAVVGATATGKSDLAVAVALALGGEVVNADAMQLYRGMDIGTAKLGRDDRRGVVHHLLDVLDPSQEASLAAFQSAARAAVADITGRGRNPVLVGGSGLYVRAALDRLDIPPTDPLVRARLEAELDAVGPEGLHARLDAVDPQAARAILPTNGRRVVRALEVHTLTGAPFRATMPDPEYAVPTLQLGLHLSREALDRRIEERVDRMWAAGIVAETAALAGAGLRDGRTASRALGYAQVLDHLAGRCDERQARDATVVATRRLARRQESWFRRDRRVVWLQADDPALVDRALAQVAAAEAAAPA